MNTELSLIIDGAGGNVFAGVLHGGKQWLSEVEREGTPLENLFSVAEEALKVAGIQLADIRSYLYCEGPGSVLGLRLCAMAIETWARLYPDSNHLWKYNSLQLCAQTLLLDTPGLTDALIVADWKKGAWNAVRIHNSTVGASEVVDNATLADWDGALYHLPQRKGWQCPPAEAQTLEYKPGRIAELSDHTDLLQPTLGVQLYNSGINTFQKWTPTRHRA